MWEFFFLSALSSVVSMHKVMMIRVNFKKLFVRLCCLFVFFQVSVMGKLNIAHHKSYHPYRRDNIERVRKDEEEARRKEENEDGRMMLAVSCHDNNPFFFLAKLDFSNFWIGL